MDSQPTSTVLPPPPEIDPRQVVIQTADPAILPPTTTSTSLEYAQACALASTRALSEAPLWRAFHAEKLNGSRLDSFSPEHVRQQMYDAALQRALGMIAHGSFVVEAGNFAALAIWEPAACTQPPQTREELAEISRQRPQFGNFLTQIEEARTEFLYPISRNFWHLCLMARDPTVPYVPGAVRAIIVPYLKKATEEEGVPVWLEAGNERARDVYAHFGFKAVRTIQVDGVPTFCMIYTGSLSAIPV